MPAMRTAAILIALTFLAGIACTAHNPAGQQQPDIFSAVLHEPGVETRNVSTEEMEAAIASGDVVVLDTRPRLEWAISHIPGALNVAPKPGTSMALYVSDVAEIDRLVNGDKTRTLSCIATDLSAARASGSVTSCVRPGTRTCVVINSELRSGARWGS